MSSISYFHSDVDAHAAEIRNRASNLESLQQAIVGHVNDVAGLWGGRGSQAFQDVLADLNKSFANIHTAANEHGQRVQAANANMHSTDAGIASSWA